MAGSNFGPISRRNVDPATVEVPVGGYVCSRDPVIFDCRQTRNEADRAKHRRPTDSSRLALPLFRDQSAHWISIAPQLLAFISTYPLRPPSSFEPGDERSVELVPLWRQEGRLRV